MSAAKPQRGFAVYDDRGGLLWSTLSDSVAEAEARFKRWNPADQFPEQFAGYAVQPVTVQPDAPPKKKAARCSDTANLFS